MAKSPPAVLVALAAGLTMTSCGGDDKPTASTAPARTEAAAGPADAKIVEEAVLRVADLPDGWISKTRPDKEQSNCAAFEEARAKSSAHKLSRQFDHAPEGSVSQTVYLYDDKQQAAAAFGNLISLEARKCRALFLRDGVKDFFKKAKVGNVGTNESSLGVLGDDSRAIRVTVDYTLSKRPRRLRQDLIFVRAGRGVSFVSLLNETEAFDKQLRARVTTIAERKLRDALVQGAGS